MSGNKLIYQTGLGERFSYGLYFTGQLVFFFLLMSFMVPYFTDIGIPALTVAAISLIVKVWDAVNDPIFGGLIDKIRFKHGKFLPWVRLSIIAIPVATIFLFSAPIGLSLSAKVIWVSIGYILWDTAYTICDVPIYGLVTTLSNQQVERNQILSLSRIFAGVGGLVVMLILPLIRQAVGGWASSAIVLSGIGVVVMLPVCLTAKERFVPAMPEKGYGIKEMITFIVKNKYLLVYYAATVICYSGNIAQGLMLYIARYNLGNEGMMAALGLMGIVPMVLVSLPIPFIIRRVDKFNVLLISVIAYILLNIISYVVGYHNVTAFLVMALLRGCGGGAYVVLMNMFTPDMVEYGRYKNGLSTSGIAFACQTFAAKLDSAIATSLAALCLGLIGFVEGEGSVQMEGFSDKLWFVFCIIPAIFGIASIPFYLKYKLRDNTVAIMAKCNNGEISCEEAEKLLGEI